MLLTRGVTLRVTVCGEDVRVQIAPVTLIVAVPVKLLERFSVSVATLPLKVPALDGDMVHV